MSYILNALRKSEQERQAQQEESLGNQILERNVQSQNKIPVWLILLIIINIVILGYFLIRYLVEPEQVPIKEDESVLAEIQKPEAIVPEIPEAVVSEEPEMVSKKSKSTSKKVDEPLSIAEMIKTRKSQPQKVSQQPEKKSQKQVAEKTAETKIKPVKETKPKEQKNAIPLLRELPYQFRRNVPDIDINVFVYSDLPENRFILVTMQKYVIGQEIVSGMVLDEIQEDGIVVKYKGRVFKIKRD